MQYTKGRGAQINSHNPFSKFNTESFFEDAIHDPSILDEDNSTQISEVIAKSIVNKVDSPDIPANWSANPYQGCEHGCIYCYARVTHEYLGYSAGKEFEQKIMAKVNAAELLDKKLSSKNWKSSPIMLSGNTDCYQPAERKYNLTRAILEVCLKHKHPVGIITKNSLILRDLDILEKLARHNLVHVHISITTLNEELRRMMEPRTSTAKQRLRTIEVLSRHNIPVNAMMAPIIPGLNSEEIFAMAKAVRDAGAWSMSHTLVRLNGAVALLFQDWLEKTYPLKASRVLNLIAESQGGKLNNSKFGERMSGSGAYAASISQQVILASTKYGLSPKLPAFNTELYTTAKLPQLDLF